jgi:peroxisomal 2,4-dienoyl-CoA reductase
MDQISANAFKSVIDIDLLGSYNTVKATLPYLVKSAAAHRTDGKRRMLRTLAYSRDIDSNFI